MSEEGESTAVMKPESGEEGEVRADSQFPSTDRK